MSSTSATAQNGVPQSAGTPLRHPLALLALGLALLAATLGAFGLGSRLTSSGTTESTGSRLAAGSLALLHARLEQQALMASLMSSGSAELSTLTAEVTALETKLNKIVSEVKTKKDEFDKLTEQTTSSESRRQALLAEKTRLDRIDMAFKAALAKKKEADALGSTGMTLTTENLTAWQDVWDLKSKDALEKIKKAKESLAELEKEAKPWIEKKDTLTPDEKKIIRNSLTSNLNKTTAILKEAREKADTAKKELIPLITSQRQQLEKAAATAPPP